MTGVGGPVRNTPGSLYHLLLMTAQKLQAHVVVIDLSPSMSKLNQLAVAMSDAIIVPAASDFFSHRSIDVLSTVLPGFVKHANELRLRSAPADDDPPQYPLPLCQPQFLGCTIRFTAVGKRIPAAQRNWVLRVQLAARKLRNVLLGLSPRDIGWSKGEADAVPDGRTPCAPGAAALTAAGVSAADCTLGYIADQPALQVFSHMLCVPTPMLEHSDIRDLCKWSQRATAYFQVPAKDAAFVWESGFQDRVAVCRSAEHRLVCTTLQLLAAGPAVTGSALSTTLTAAASAAWVARHAGPPLTPGPYQADFHPFEMYPGSREIERAFVRATPFVSFREARSDDGDDDDNDAVKRPAVVPAAAGAAAAAAAGMAASGSGLARSSSATSAAGSGSAAATGGAGTGAAVSGVVRRRPAWEAAGGMAPKRARLLTGSAAATGGASTDPAPAGFKPEDAADEGGSDDEAAELPVVVPAVVVAVAGAAAGVAAGGNDLANCDGNDSATAAAGVGSVAGAAAASADQEANADSASEAMGTGLDAAYEAAGQFEWDWWEGC